MENAIVTVVIPVYNVECYLDRCMQSIVNQSYKNLEIILVDDGSKDSCPLLCDEWANKDSRVKVIHKKNAGLGMARNTGIENATGEYICFFDSDDYIALDTIEILHDSMMTNDADIVLFGGCNVDSNGKVINSIIPNLETLVYEGKEVTSFILPNLITHNPITGEQTNLWMSACLAMYSMKLINSTNWRFVSERNIISEDVFSLLCLYNSVNKVTIIKKALYYYCENEKSLTHTYRKDRYERIRHFYVQSINKAKELGYSNDVIIRLDYPYISFTIAALKQIVFSSEKYSVKKDEIKKILNDECLQNVLKNIRLHKTSTRRRLLFLIMSLRNYIFLYFFIRVKK